MTDNDNCTIAKHFTHNFHCHSGGKKQGGNCCKLYAIICIVIILVCLVIAGLTFGVLHLTQKPTGNQRSSDPIIFYQCGYLTRTMGYLSSEVARESLDIF